MSDNVRVSFTTDEFTATVLDALAFVRDVRSASPRSTLIKRTIEDMAKHLYDTDDTLRELVDITREQRSLHRAEARHPSRVLRVVE